MHELIWSIAQTGGRFGILSAQTTGCMSSRSIRDRPRSKLFGIQENYVSKLLFFLQARRTINTISKNAYVSHQTFFYKIPPFVFISNITH